MTEAERSSRATTREEKAAAEREAEQRRAQAAKSRFVGSMGGAGSNGESAAAAGHDPAIDESDPSNDGVEGDEQQGEQVEGEGSSGARDEEPSDQDEDQDQDPEQVQRSRSERPQGVTAELDDDAQLDDDAEDEGVMSVYRHAVFDRLKSELEAGTRRSVHRVSASGA